MIEIIGIIHLLLIIFINLYIFIIPKNFYYDISYIYYYLFLIILWIYHDDKCPVTYYYNKYITDIDGNNNSDIYKILHPQVIKYLFIINIIIIFITYINIYYASIRSNIMTPLITILFIIVNFIYKFYNKHDIEPNKLGHAIFGKLFSKIEKIYDDSGFHKMTEPYFNNGILIIQFLFLIYIFVHNKKRLHI